MATKCLCLNKSCYGFFICKLHIIVAFLFIFLCVKQFRNIKFKLSKYSIIKLLHEAISQRNIIFYFFKCYKFCTLKHEQMISSCAWQGPGGLWCDVDVVEFSYYGTSPIGMPKEQLHTELVQGLQGNNTRIGPGSQVTTLAECLNIFGVLGE